MARAKKPVKRKDRRGGRRPGAGRPPKKELRRAHVVRPKLSGKHPVHVVMFMAPGLPDPRRGAGQAALVDALAAGAEREGFRICLVTVAPRAVHILCEAADKRALSRGMQAFSIRFARGVNRRLGRSGSVLACAYHSHELPTAARVDAALEAAAGPESAEPEVELPAPQTRSLRRALGRR